MSSDEPKKPTDSREWDPGQIPEGEVELVFVLDQFMAYCDVHGCWCMVLVAVRKSGEEFVVHYKEVT